MNPKGGYGICKYCQGWHPNVSFHEAWECLSRPDVGLNPIIEQKVEEPKGLQFDCDGCGKPMQVPGALLFSPPTLMANEKDATYMTVRKFHLCPVCYENVCSKMGHLDPMLPRTKLI